MKDEADMLRDPGLQKMLAQRSRWRWGLSASLIGAYFAYCLAGIYFNAAFSRVVLGTSITLGILLGYLIMTLAIVLSVVYVRIVGRLLRGSLHGRESGQ